MKLHFLAIAVWTLIATLHPAPAEAQTPGCEPGGKSVQVQIPTDGAPVDATLCKNGDEAILVTKEPVSREHLIYFGINLGLPFLGYEATYVHKSNQRQRIHAAIGTEGSLGASALTVRGGYHPWGNSVFVGGNSRLLFETMDRRGFMLGPTIGLSGGGKFITGFVSIGMMGSLEGEPKNLHAVPDLSFGMRIRILKIKKQK